LPDILRIGHRYMRIHVDRFYKLKNKGTQQITLKDIDETPEKVFIVFKELNSLLPLYNSGDKYVQRRFPKGAKASVLAYKIIDGQPWIYYEDIKGASKYTMNFKPCKFPEIKEIFANIQT